MNQRQCLARWFWVKSETAKPIVDASHFCALNTGTVYPRARQYTAVPLAQQPKNVHNKWENTLVEIAAQTFWHENVAPHPNLLLPSRVMAGPTLNGWTNFSIPMVLWQCLLEAQANGDLATIGNDKHMVLNEHWLVMGTLNVHRWNQWCDTLAWADVLWEQ